MKTIYWLALCAGCAAPMAQAADSANSARWISAVWTEARDSARPDAKPVAAWPANTRVILLATAGKTCKVRADDGAEGHVPCAELAPRPLAIADLKPGEGGDADPRLFWVSPSFKRFLNYGGQLDSLLLTPEQLQKQNAEMEPIYFPYPPYEAMKKKLAAGIRPDFDQSLQREPPADPASAAGTAGWNERSNGGRREPVTLRLLPAARPSLFQKQSSVVLLTESSVDAIAGLYAEPSTGVAGGKPMGVGGGNDEGVYKAWDVIEVAVQFPRPAILHAVGRNGLVSAAGIAGATESVGPGDGCDGGYTPLPEGAPLPGYPQVNERLVAFYLPDALPLRKAKVATRRVRRMVVGDSGIPAPEDSLMHGIDLNEDGAADIAVFESQYLLYENTTVSEFEFFLNIAGKWWRAGYDSYSECS